MNVLIRGMQMPKECRECPMMDYGVMTGRTYCDVNGKTLAESYRPIKFDGRPDWCPLVALPENHGRLIDADALMNIFADRLTKVSVRYGIDSAVAGAVSGAMKLLDVQPTVIEAEDNL